MSYNSPFTGNVIQPTDVSFRQFTIAVDTTLSWPLNGNATNNYAARIMQVTASSAGLSLLMPPANQTSVGTDALILNVGSNTFTVKDYDGNTIVSIAAGSAQYIYVTTNPNTAGTWGIIAFGAGSSGGNASTLSGYGLTPSGQTINQSHPAKGVADGYSILSSDRAQVLVWTGGTGGATLPSAASTGDNWFFLLKNNGTGTFTLSCSGADLIDNNAIMQFQPDESAFIVCTGSTFISIGYGQSASFFLTVLVKSVTGGSYLLTASETANIIQEYVGTLSSNVTVVYPPIVQLYVVSNQTVDNGYTLTLTTGIVGGAVAIIPPGQQATVICDGTNFLNANTVQAGATSWQVLDGTAASPSISFASETSTGIFRPSAGQFGISVLGSQIFAVTGSGIEVTGTGTFSGGISGGTF